MTQIDLFAKTRETGTPHVKRLRLKGMVPIVIYGGHQPPVSLCVSMKDLQKSIQEESFFSRILHCSIEQPDGTSSIEAVVIKDLMRHPFKPSLLHADFQRIKADEMIQMHVPLHVLDEEICIGVKQEGGVLNVLMPDIEVRCFPQHLPPFLSLSVASLKLHHAYRLSDLNKPQGVVCVGSDDAVVVSVSDATTDDETTISES